MNSTSVFAAIRSIEDTGTLDASNSCAEYSCSSSRLQRQQAVRTHTSCVRESGQDYS